MVQSTYSRDRPVKPMGGTILLAIPFLLSLLGLLEWMVRQPSFQDRVAFPYMGSRHSQIGAKYARLLALEREVGHVDCIAIGSSTMDQAFNPIVFAAAYQEKTGQPIHCFNFAIDAIVPSANRQIAAILVEDFRPDLLIVGTDARDLAIEEDDQDVTVVTETPWVRYRSGQCDIRGWLMEYSYAYRYGWSVKQLLRGQITEVLREEETPAVVLGQTPKESTGVNIEAPAHEDEYLTAYYRERLGNYRILPENTTGLRQILNMNGASTRVILVEMPVPSAFFQFFGNPKADYNAFVTEVEQLTDESQVPFLRTLDLNVVPDHGWFDFSHVNTIGAGAFSEWLGDRIGMLAQK